MAHGNRRTETHGQAARNLWQKASDELGKKLTLKFDISGNAKALPDEILDVVQHKVIRSREKQWKFRKRNGDEVFVREIFESIIEWLDRFKSVGDTIVQYDPGHAALPWAGVRMLLQIAGNDVKTNCAVAEGIETVSRVIARNAEVEKISLRGSSALTSQLEDALVRLYKNVLLYLDFAQKYFSKSTTVRLAKSLVGSPDRISNLLIQIAADETAVERLVSYVSEEKGQLQLAAIQTTLDEITNAAQDNHKAALIEYLDAEYTDDRLDDLLYVRHRNTAQWLFSRSIFKEWVANDFASTKFLWIHAPPGRGKSVLCASIVEHLQRSRSNTVAYFFCSSEHQARMEPFNILRSWLAQLIQQSDRALQVFSQEVDMQHRRPLLVSKQWRLLQIVCKAIGQSCLIIDGFDECPDLDRSTISTSGDTRSRFLKDLLHNLCDLPVRLLMVSRDIVDIRNEMSHARHKDGLHITECRIEKTDTRDDLAELSQSIVNSVLSKRDTELQREIAEAASHKADGMFLWLHLLRKKIRPGNSEEVLRDTVSKMPSGLEKTYQKEISSILMNRDEEEKARAQNLLKWILFSDRPMTVGELVEADLVRRSTSGLYPARLLPHGWSSGHLDESYVDDAIRQSLGSLIEIRKKDPYELVLLHTVHVTHHSVREYLLGSNGDGVPRFNNIFSLGMQSVREYLAEQCLRYLCYQIFSQKEIAEHKSADVLVQEHPFLAFAVYHWSLLLGDSTRTSGAVSDLAIELFNPDRSNWIVVSKVYEKQRKTERRLVSEQISLDPQDPGWSSEESSSEDETDDDEERWNSPEDGDHPSPLLEKVCQRYTSDDMPHTAISHSNEAQSDPRTQEERRNVEKTWGTPLIWACRFGMIQAVKELCSRGEDVNRVGGRYGNALHCAIAHDHDEIAFYLLDQGADPLQRTKYAPSAIILAVLRNKQNLVWEFIKRKVNLRSNWKTARGKIFMTPLGIAASSGFYDLAVMLLDANVDIDEGTGDANVYTALAWASSEGNLAMAKLLLERGADVNAASGLSGETALHEAATALKVECAELLLSKGAEVNSRSRNKSTPLHLAVSTVSPLSNAEALPNIINTLVSFGADVHAQDSRGATPLHRAESVQAVDILLKNGADATAATLVDMTPLHKMQLLDASCATQASLLLLSNGADANARTKDGITPLHWAIRREAAEVLLDHRADISAVDRHGCTPLMRAVNFGRSEVAKILLERGSEVDGRYTDGSTPVFRAAGTGDVELLQMLLNRGADAAAVSTIGLTALHYAVNADCARLLLEFGAGVNALDACDRTPLHVACRQESSALVQVLLDHGADVHAVDECGDVALRIAVEHRRADSAEILLKSGANAKAANRQGVTPLSTAVAVRSKVLRLVLAKHIEFDWPELNAGQQIPDSGEQKLYRDYQIALFLDDKEQISTITALMLGQQRSQVLLNGAFLMAAWFGHISGVEEFLSQGAELTARYTDGYTALHLAAQGGSAQLVKLLVQRGLDPDERGNCGRTVFDAAACYGIVNKATLKILTGRHISLRDSSIEEDESPHDAESSRRSLSEKWTGNYLDITTGSIVYCWVIVDKPSGEPANSTPCFTGSCGRGSQEGFLYGRLVGQTKILWSLLLDNYGLTFEGKIDSTGDLLTGKWSCCPGTDIGVCELKRSRTST